jgi:hypothetical protein
LYSSPNQNEFNSYGINPNEPISIPFIPIQELSQPPIQSAAAAKLYQRLKSKSTQILANPQTYRPLVVSQPQPVQNQPYDGRYIDI